MCSVRSCQENVADDDTMSTEDLLEAFRRKKAQAAQQSAKEPKEADADASATAPAKQRRDEAPPASEEPAPAGAPDAQAPSKDHPAPRGPAGPRTPATPPPKVDAPDAEKPSDPMPPAAAKTNKGPGPEAKEPQPTPDPEPEPEADASPGPEGPGAGEAEAEQPVSSPVRPPPEHGTASGPEPGPEPKDATEEPAPGHEDAQEPEGEADETPPPSRASSRPPQGLPSDDPVVDVAHRHRASDPTPVTAGARSLAPMDPSLGLAHRLERDHLVTRQKDSIYYHIAVGVALLGLTLLAVDRLVFALQGNILLGGVRLTWIAIIIAVLGAVAAPTLWFTLKERTLAVRFAASQEEEWERAAARVRLMMTLRWVGLGVAAAGPLVVVIAGAVQADERVLPLAYTGFALLAAGLILAVVAYFMHHLSIRDYIQTTVLWILERTGLPHRDASATDAPEASEASVDPRIPEVLRTLDGLLSQLPDSAVAKFMQTPEAKAYLELMDSMPEA